MLIVGCGDVGLRVAAALHPRVRLIALTSSSGRIDELRSRGITPLLGDLDRPASLARLAGLATRVVHLAPPASEGDPQWWRDARTQALLRRLRLRNAPASLVYASTSGVYGDCAGERVAETRRPQPRTPRAQRRLNAEKAVRHFGRAAHVQSSILRVPGIYAPDRVGVGSALRFFGDGFQISKVIDGQRFWRIPVMEGEFLVEERFTVAEVVNNTSRVDVKHVRGPISVTVSSLEYCPG